MNQLFVHTYPLLLVLRPWWLGGKESTCQYGRCGFDPWVRKIFWRRKWQPIPVFLPGEFHGQGAWQATVRGVAESTHACASLLNLPRSSPPPSHHLGSAVIMLHQLSPLGALCHIPTSSRSPSPFLSPILCWWFSDFLGHDPQQETLFIMSQRSDSRMNLHLKQKFHK